MISKSNKNSIAELSPINRLQQNSEGTINFKLLPSDPKSGQRESKVRVRAHFDYVPEDDPYIPCKEAGLQFERGDVLHIVAQVNTHRSSATG